MTLEELQKALPHLTKRMHQRLMSHVALPGEYIIGVFTIFVEMLEHSEKILKKITGKSIAPEDDLRDMEADLARPASEHILTAIDSMIDSAIQVHVIHGLTSFNDDD